MCKIYCDYCIDKSLDISIIPFVDYHSFNIHDTVLKTNNRTLFNTVGCVKNTTHKKILMGNVYSKPFIEFFKCDIFVELPISNWYDEYSIICEKLYSYIQENEDTLILMSGGIATRILIGDLIERYTRVSVIDMGAGFDILSDRKNSRPWTYTFTDACNYFGI